MVKLALQSSTQKDSSKHNTSSGQEVNTPASAVTVGGPPTDTTVELNEGFPHSEKT